MLHGLLKRSLATARGRRVPLVATTGSSGSRLETGYSNRETARLRPVSAATHSSGSADSALSPHALLARARLAKQVYLRILPLRLETRRV